MSKEYIFEAKTLEEAVEKASSELGIKADEIKYELISEPKKGLFGIGAQDAKIKVTKEESTDEVAVNFVKTVLSDLGLPTDKVELNIVNSKEAVITVEGDGMGLIIGHHGEILESLMYLTNLAANKVEDGCRRYIVDVENYREKRQEALKKLAQKTAARAKRQGRNITLEPMSAYERRIIHSEIQDVEGVTTFSIGSGDQRKVVVSPENQRSHKPKTSEPRAPKAEPKKKREIDPDIPLTYAGGGVSKQPIVKAKSIEELGLADPDESEIY